jgi:hypothetical protein
MIIEYYSGAFTLWFKGLEQVNLPELFLLKTFVIIIGHRGVGKSILGKGLSEVNSNIYYLEVQKLHHLPLSYTNNAVDIIEVRRVK